MSFTNHCNAAHNRTVSMALLEMKVFPKLIEALEAAFHGRDPEGLATIRDTFRTYVLEGHLREGWMNYLFPIVLNLTETPQQDPAVAIRQACLALQVTMPTTPVDHEGFGLGTS